MHRDNHCLNRLKRSMRSCIGWLPVSACLMAAASPARAEVPVIIEPRSLDLDTLHLIDATVSPESFEGESVLRITLGHEARWPHVLFDAGKAYQRTDWSGYHVLSMPMYNPTSEPVRVQMRVDCMAQGSDRVISRAGYVFLEPMQWTEARFDVSTHVYPGLKGQPRHTGISRAGGLWFRWHNQGMPHPQNIVAFQFFLAHPDRDSTFLLGQSRLLGETSDQRIPFVDRFGQYTLEEWSGKVHDEAQLQQQHEQELEELAAHPGAPGRSTYGGWKDGPKLEATGQFRVQKYDGKWSLVDPEGYLFWSAGIDCVRHSTVGSIEKFVDAYTWLPEPGSQLAPFYDRQEQTLDWAKINLYRKFGEDFMARSDDLAMKRLKSWGMNTLGNWSAPETWDQKQVPYTIPVWFRGPAIAVHGSKTFPDVYDPAFVADLRAALGNHADRKGDPWLLGVFIHNEMPLGGYTAEDNGRYSLAKAFLRNAQQTQTRQKMVEHLRSRYETIEQLNASWGTSMVAWDQLLEDGISLDQAQEIKAAVDLQAFNRLIVEKYFAECRRAMDDILPGTLYLGSRFSAYSREAVEAAAEYCDVVTYNIYESLPTYKDADEMATELDFPVMIGEFHFGALDRGMFHGGLQTADDQSQQAQKFTSFVRAGIEAPWCVGAHWFQYRDQSITGRFDGENYGIGFVSGTDTPHPGLKEASRGLLYRLYELRYPGAKP